MVTKIILVKEYNKYSIFKFCVRIKYCQAQKYGEVFLQFYTYLKSSVRSFECIEHKQKFVRLLVVYINKTSI